MNHEGTQHGVGTTYNTYLVNSAFGPAKSTVTGAPTSTGFGFDVFLEFLHNTSTFFGYGVRAGYAHSAGDDTADFAYGGFPIMVEAAVGTRAPGPLDEERKLIGSISGLALSLHAGVGYVVAGSLRKAKDSASTSGYRANLGLRLTLPVTLVQFTLSAEVAYMASSTVMLASQDTSFQSTTLLFSNIVAF